jgi:stage II sporulation protein Q
MDEQKQGFSKEEAPKFKQGAKVSNTVSGSKWKKFLAKKWVFPATYVAAAAIILTLMWVFQGVGQVSKEKAALDLTSKSSPDAVAVNVPQETMQWPVADAKAVTVVIPFYDQNASSEDRQAAMIEYDKTLIPSLGLGIASKDKQTFDVLAAMSGKVTAVETDPVVGKLVEITHSNGLVTVYQSLANVKVTKDMEVKKGDVIAQAGRNELEKAQEVHLHFEVRQTSSDGPAVNPNQYLAQLQ